MPTRRDISTGGVLEQLTLPELVEIWVEPEINRRLQEVDVHSWAIVQAARNLGTLQVLPERGGFHDHPGSVEVLVEVRDAIRRRSRIGAWNEKKTGKGDWRAFNRAYEKATAHAIIQLLPAAVWRPWIGVPSG